jgi:hypothetical protein
MQQVEKGRKRGCVVVKVGESQGWDNWKRGNGGKLGMESAQRGGKGRERAQERGEGKEKEGIDRGDFGKEGGATSLIPLPRGRGRVDSDVRLVQRAGGEGKEEGGEHSCVCRGILGRKY